MRTRLALGCALAALAAGALAPAQASALERINATFLAEYSSEAYRIDQGEIVTFANNDKFLSHGIDSDAAGFFGADVIERGRVRLVRGAPFLTAAGSPYAFHCPIHPGMRSVLNVTTAGAPLAPDAIRPTARVKVKVKNVGKLLKQRRLRLTVTASEAADAVIRAGVSGVSIGRQERTYVAPGRKAIALRLSGADARAIATRAAARPVGVKVKVTLADVAGNAAVVKAKKTLGAGR